MGIENKNIRILLCDDHYVLREGIISMLSNERDLLIIGEAENGIELVDKYFKLKPDIVITDIEMPGLTGIEALRQIKNKDNDVKALFLSIHEGIEYIFYTYKAGGSGLINKNIVRGELVYAIRAILNGNLYFGANISENELNQIIKQYENSSKHFKWKDINYDITHREAEILTMIGEGITSVGIAEKLHLSKRTIDSHRANLMHKLKLKSLPELITFSVEFNQSRKKKN